MRVLLFAICSGVLLGMVVNAQRVLECPDCERTACEKVSEEICPAGVLLDECGCCSVCGRTLDQNCGGKFWNLGRCGRDYYCSGPHPDKAINIRKGEVGFCKCRESKRVCGNDGNVYENVCSMNETSHEQRKHGGNKIEVSRDRKICRSAPRLQMVNPSNSSSTTKHLGEQTYMQCEGEGFPAPLIAWTKDGAILPGDHANIAVQTIGGPQENQATGWLLISPVTQADAGEYTCEVTNGEGDILRATMFLDVTDA
ncbi:insulin-like growth factor-binding protein 7 [Lytechinus variegatus]|uniref:insulin-like growth factor-binding protein 7 n=1 Tax=Lytechinus variegatus TaxID=7654 RepID=UPI001BB2152A|nr:insulin-like growth factor-binding protein 7 [Lytechinus variegatus]